MDVVLRKVQERVQRGLKRRGAGARYFSNTRRGEGAELQAELNSQDMARQKSAVKRIIANMALGREVSYLFVDVVKLGQTTNLELKKLVYLYVLSTAKLQPDKALMAVNTFLQDALSPSPIVRALAIRSMLCIRVPDVLEYTLEPLRRAVADGDPYVRKTAAMALGKLFHNDMDLFVEHDFAAHVVALAHDVTPMVASNAAAVLAEVNDYGDNGSNDNNQRSSSSGGGGGNDGGGKGGNNNSIHDSDKDESSRHRRRGSPRMDSMSGGGGSGGGGELSLAVDASLVSSLMTQLPDFTEWGQVYVLELLSSYKPRDAAEAESLVLRVLPRLGHTNAAVVMAAIKLIANMASRCGRDVVERCTVRINAALLSLATADAETQYVVCKNVHALLVVFPNLLRTNLDAFFVRFNDPAFVKLEKLRLLLKLVTPATAPLIVKELIEYSSDVDPLFVEEVLQAAAALALKVDVVAESCAELLMRVLVRHGELLARVLTAAANMMRKYPTLSLFEQLLTQYSVDAVVDEDAKAALVWMLGEYGDRTTADVDVAVRNNNDNDNDNKSSSAQTVAASLLQHYVDTLLTHEASVQLAIVSAVIKAFLRQPDAAVQQRSLHSVLDTVTRHSVDPDVRDRAVAYWRLLSKGMDASRLQSIAHGNTAPVNVDRTFSDAMTMADLKRSINTAAVVYGKPYHAFLPPYGLAAAAALDSEDSEVDSEVDGDVEDDVVVDDASYHNNSNSNSHRTVRGREQASQRTVATAHTDPLDDLFATTPMPPATNATTMAAAAATTASAVLPASSAATSQASATRTTLDDLFA